MEFHDVVIVGAGMAGLAAADLLHRNNRSDVLILEAQDRIGGRVHTIPAGGQLVELGAQWIHGEGDNPLFGFCAERGLVDAGSVSYESEGRYHTSGAAEVAADLVEKGRAIVRDAYEECRKFTTLPRELWGEDQLPTSVEAFFRRKFFEHFDAGDPVHDGLFDWFMLLEKCENACDSMAELSPTSWGEWSFCEGEWRINLRNGVSSVVDALVDQLNNNSSEPSEQQNKARRNPEIRLNEAVEKIEWKPTAELRRETLGISGEHGGRLELVKLTTSSGRTYSTTAVIVTSSLGFLKEHVDDFFLPPLPPRVDAAIRSLGFGVIDKIFLEFPYPFWEAGCKGIHFIWTEPVSPGSTMRENWVRGVSGFDPVVNQTNMLLCWVGGREARCMEELTEDEVKHDLWELLRRFTGNADIPEPARLFRSKWWSDPYARGSFSYRNLQADAQGVKATDLAEPAFCHDTVDPNLKIPVVMLAGEAQHLTHYTTVHGAYQAGQDAAKILLNRVEQL